MSSITRIGLCTIALGCAKPATQSDLGPVSPHPDLQCPALSIPAGKAPPVGYEVWCHTQGEPGKWLREGPSIAWHSNAQRASEGLYAAGKRTGPWQIWYPTGQPKEQGSYVGGVKEGVWTSYHPDGTRSSEGEMVQGQQHGAWNYWSPDGQSRTEGQWKLGEKDGVWHELDADDRKVSERVYRNGRLLTQKEL